MKHRFATTLLALLALCAPALIVQPALAADARTTPRTALDVTFPLKGYYRLGRYMPIRISGDLPAGSKMLVGGIGAVPVEAKSDGTRSSIVLPVLPVLPLGQLTVSLRTPGAHHDEGFDVRSPMLALTDDQSLVGSSFDVSNANELTAELFPGKHVVPITLDSADPLPEPAVAWGALDAVLLDAAGATRVAERQLKTLLAAGTVVAIRTDQKPGGRWPWQRRGTWWVLRPDMAGPDSAIVEQAYAPVLTWSPGRSANARRTIVLGLGAFAVAALAATLWRAKRAWTAVVAISIIATGSLALWRSTEPLARDAAGRIVVNSSNWTQSDAWNYRSAVEPGELTQPAESTDPDSVVAITWPLYASPRHFNAIDLRLECAPDGNPLAFRPRLFRGQQIAFLSRSVEPGSKQFDADPSPAGSSPLRSLADAFYVHRGDRVIGDAHQKPTPSDPSGDSEAWPDVHVERVPVSARSVE